jgi:hypothetical protein
VDSCENRYELFYFMKGCESFEEMTVTVSCHLQVSPQVGRFVACFWPQSPGFDPKAVHVTVAVTK